MPHQMTENGHRRDMHSEQIAGFRAMAQEGKTPAQTGDLLGYSPRHVQRMLKLADLAPVILDAPLAEDRITTEHCQALALENDTTRQVQVFEAACQSGWGGKPDVRVIRNLITESEVAVAGNSKFRFVGADAFSPDELRTDLFSDDGDGYVDRVGARCCPAGKTPGCRRVPRKPKAGSGAPGAWSLSVSVVITNVPLCRSRKRC